MDFKKAKEKVKTKRQEERIGRMEDRYHRASVILGLQEHDGVKELFKWLRMRINSINELLLTNDKMTQQERDKAFTERSCWEDVIAWFGNEEVRKKTIEEYIEKL